MKRKQRSLTPFALIAWAALLSATLAYGQQTETKGTSQEPAPQQQGTAPQPKEQATQAQQGDAAMPKSPEQKVLSQMHEKNKKMMMVGQIAMEKGASEEVRSYGKRLVNDHSFGDRKVQGMAETKGIELVQVPQSEQEEQKEQKMMKQLKQLSGAEFDRFFLKAMKKGHSKSIGMLNQALEKLEDEDVRRLVRRMLPILEQHLVLAGHVQDGQEPQTALKR